ncbi:MAG: hypothetical protein GY795_40975 [Desulfobacterales bacterium]|nr:hypothetical protein [Desulfobacterales bacterium]
MKQKKNFILALMCCLCFALSDSNAKARSNETRPLISAYTSGEISRESTIRVRFSEDMAVKINAPLEKSPISFTPEIKGVAVWIDKNTLEFRPEKRLSAGMHFAATLDLSQITPPKSQEPKAKSQFKFDFTAMNQAFEIFIDGLEAGPRKKNTFRLTGKIVTADAEPGANIIKILSAVHAGKGVNIQWTHGKKRRNHSFIINGIRKLDDPSEVVLKWDGTPIKVDKKGDTKISVPSLKPFEVLQARAVYGETRHIEIRFSDPLDKDQNLDGLIQIDGPSDLRFTVEGSILRVYNSFAWQTNEQVQVDAGVRNAKGHRLDNEKTLEVSFEEIKPEVRFTGKGVIVPTTRGLTIPIETVNLRAVIVEAMQIYEKNTAQFLQVNNLDGSRELTRVGKVVWKKTVSLNYTPEKRNQWLRHGLDLTPLVDKNVKGLFRIQLSFTPRHIVYECEHGNFGQEPDNSDQASDEASDENWDTEEQETSYWDYSENNHWKLYENRDNPCHQGYYRAYNDHNITISRNVLISDIGLIAKRGGNNDIFVAVTDLKTAKPLRRVKLKLLNYQQQVLDTVSTDSAGIAVLRSEEIPFLIVAEHKGQAGYLRLDNGSALSVSHFDVAGHTVKKGIKGFIYGERGVWRPGDPIYLTFILMDEQNKLPENHPVLFDLRNPKGQVVKTIKKKESVNGFYSFKTQTDHDAPTGNWTARVRIGGVVFEKVLKIETVMPNRLKIKLDFGEDKKTLSGGTINAELSAKWLHGAIAKNLKADLDLAFSEKKTRFPKYEEYSFDDPARTYKPEKQTIFKGNLDEKGVALVKADIWAKNDSPGMLSANFRTRVFEPGGAFSIDRFSIPYHPYERYVGIRTPKGDKARGMLLTDTPHTARIVMLDTEGNPVPEGKAEVSLYQIKWRWWWEKERESLASYIGTSSYTPIKEDTVEIKDGAGEWQFEIKYPAWGRYLIRVKDTNGKHYAGKIVYIDWPGWAGRAQKDSPGGATVLSFSADKEKYQVGEDIVLTIPTGKKGRGLVSIESGTRVVRIAWIESGDQEAVRYKFRATSEMAPNVYANVTFLQPHMQTENDLPIRMYGVIPLKIEDPGTRLKPVIETADTFAPEGRAEITVSEASGRPMTYTLAIVDEGLLDLTRFKTPDPRSHFYKREALGVKTWDIYDMVAGAYGGALEQILAIGGDGAFGKKGKKKANRFPPMVRFIGPFFIKSNVKKIHFIDIPQYVGSVRIMVVAGQDRAFGFQEKAVFVRKPLMVLATLPRVIGPDEEVDMPVSVFALDEKVKNVSMAVKTSGPISVTGPSEKSIAFSEPGDDLIIFKLKAKPRTGIATISLEAVSDLEKAGHTIELDVRIPGGLPIADVVDTVVSKGETWKELVKFPGIPGTNKVSLEISRVPPLDLGKRLRFLIRYPHGCVEQTTSSVFPQLYLDRLMELSPKKQDEIQKNIKAGITRLRTFQNTDGGFGYWPGQRPHGWASNYVGHFLVEARNAGYAVPQQVVEQWKSFQRKQARSWSINKERAELIQAYRLYTLALAGSAELGAMNRLRELRKLPTAARWRLAAAYQLAGQPEAAEQMTKDNDVSVKEYRELSNTYGSDLRDRAMILETLSLMKRIKAAIPVAKTISSELSRSKYFSTQTTAYALIAMAKYTGYSGETGNMEFAFSWNQGQEQVISSLYPLVQRSLDTGDRSDGVIQIRNTGETMLYPRVIIEGIPPVGSETASKNGMSIDVEYLTLKGKAMDCSSLDQGTDFVVQVSIKNTGYAGRYEEIALSHIFPPGWEIRNMRMDPGVFREKDSGFDYQDIRDDRVYTYFDIDRGEKKTFRVMLNASYTGKFYLPMVMAEAMYDATINARVPGQWITVNQPGD